MMMQLGQLKLHVSVILVILTPLDATGISDITSYAKVSRTGAATSTNSEDEVRGRSFQPSPVYVPSNIAKLHNGEVQDYPAAQQYSTLDEEMVAHLDDKKQQQQRAQDRFVPHANKVNFQNDGPSDKPGNFPDSPVSSESYSTLPKNLYGDTYDYQGALKPSKDNLPSITIDSYPPGNYNPKPDDSYPPITYTKPQSPVDNYNSKPDDSYPSIPFPKPKIPSYLEKFPEQPDYSDNPDDHSFVHDHYPHELIYDHPPEHYHHDFTTTTEPPVMNDQRLNKRPYSYYYIGKKLWYLPLYFSIYFIIYIAALVLKSIARHKINFPSHLAEAAGARHLNQRDNNSWWDLTRSVLDGIDEFASEYTYNKRKGETKVNKIRIE